jgi:hypothetical protein
MPDRDEEFAFIEAAAGGSPELWIMTDWASALGAR